MSVDGQHVAVVGAGIGGLATAVPVPEGEYWTNWARACRPTGSSTCSRGRCTTRRCGWRSGCRSAGRSSTAVALEELRELARGIYPVLLTAAGLGSAIATLAECSSIPAVVDAVPGGRLPDPGGTLRVASPGRRHAADRGTAVRVSQPGRSST